MLQKRACFPQPRAPLAISKRKPRAHAPLAISKRMLASCRLRPPAPCPSRRALPQTRCRRWTRRTRQAPSRVRMVTRLEITAVHANQFRTRLGMRSFACRRTTAQRLMLCRLVSRSRSREGSRVWQSFGRRFRCPRVPLRAGTACAAAATALSRRRRTTPGSSQIGSASRPPSRRASARAPASPLPTPCTASARSRARTGTTIRSAATGGRPLRAPFPLRAIGPLRRPPRRR